MSLTGKKGDEKEMSIVIRGPLLEGAGHYLAFCKEPEGFFRVLERCANLFLLELRLRAYSTQADEGEKKKPKSSGGIKPSR